MNRPDPKPCEFCGKMVKFGYPGNDPENGPAAYYCPKWECQDKEAEYSEAYYLNTLTADERADIFRQENEEAEYAAQAYRDVDHHLALEYNALTPEARNAKIDEDRCLEAAYEKWLETLDQPSLDKLADSF